MLSMNAFGVHAHLTEIEADIAFTYFHPLSTPDLHGASAKSSNLLRVSGETILRFGFVEGDALVDGERVVHDPQNWRDALTFCHNGSRATALAVVLNEVELKRSTGLTGASAVQMLLDKTGASVAVVKRGPHGAAVFEAGGIRSNVPAFRTPVVFKIGSGDVFSAHFAYEWAERRRPAADAALAASRAVARYVATRDIQASGAGEEFPTAPVGEPGRIYLAGPFFTLSQRWLVEEARDAFMRLGAPVFSPLHEVGTGGGPTQIAKLDLEGLRGCRAMLALIDGEDAGTLFEIGYARDRGIAVIAFSEAPRPESLTMLEGSGCSIVTDFTSAVYQTVWAACE